MSEVGHSRIRPVAGTGHDSFSGHVAPEAAPVYVGRIGLTNAAGTPLLVDWRTPAAEPFFAPTLADPRGVTYRRRYRWSGGHIVDYWDEVFGDDDEVSAHVSPDDLSAFVSSLSEARTGRMRDVLTTIQADQDAIIRADSRGALIVDAGPGTPVVYKPGSRFSYGPDFSVERSLIDLHRLAESLERRYSHTGFRQ